MAVWNKYHLEEGDVVTLLAHLQHYVQHKAGVH